MLNTYATNQNLLNQLPKSMFGLAIPPGFAIEMSYSNNSFGFTFDPLKIFQKTISIVQKAESEFGGEVGSYYMDVARDVALALQKLINKGIEEEALDDLDFELIDHFYNNLEQIIIGNVLRKMDSNPKQ